MTLENEVEAIGQSLSSTANTGATAYQQIFDTMKLLTADPANPAHQGALIASAAQLWLAGVNFTALSARAAGRISAELAQMDPNTP